MRRTAKYVKAIDAVSKANLVIGDRGQAEVYQLLEENGWYWVDGEWTKHRPQTSLFETGGDQAAGTGLFNLRVMAHPDDIPKVMALLRPHLSIWNESDLYPNRKGPGVRLYLNCKL